MRIIGQITDYRETRELDSRPVYGGLGGVQGIVTGYPRSIVTVTINADEVDLAGPMGADLLSMNVILHPGTGCSWTEQRAGYKVVDRRGVGGKTIEDLERERDAYRREAEAVVAERDRLKKEVASLKAIVGIRGERAAEAVKKGAPARMVNLDVDVDDCEDK